MSRRKKKSKEHAGHIDDRENIAGADDVRDPASTEETGIEPADAGDPNESGRAASTMEAELEQLGRESAQMRELAQRTRAEFENYRKRMERERADLVRHAGFEVVKEILPVLDNLERAIRASESSPEEQFRAGVEIIQRQFQEILTRMGLSVVESEGKPFDPHLHEAVSRVETTKHPEGTVVEVFQKGYSFKDRLVRPAMVAVAQSPPGGGSSPPDRGEVVRESE
jgi:molecular chaperone GrpE